MCKRFSVYICLALSACSLSHADSVTSNNQWARGIDLFSGKLNIGGYANIGLEPESNQKNSLKFKDLSLFISASPSDSIRFFSEIELENSLTTKRKTNINSALRIERLYIDYLASEDVTLRLGKWLTLFGRWNVIHAAPLVWTTSLPFMTSEQFFPSHSSGVMLSKKFDVNNHNLDVSFYIDDSEHLDPRKDPIDFENAIGTRINMEVSKQLQLGFSYLGSKQANIHEARNHLFGADLFWRYNDYELQAEFSYRHRPSPRNDEKALYVQGVAPLAGKVFAVGRYEFLTGRHHVDLIPLHSTVHSVITGLAWRPFTPLVLKAEYRFASQNQIIAPSGFFTSIAVLF